jgi:hypothetical protein
VNVKLADRMNDSQQEIEARRPAWTDYSPLFFLLLFYTNIQSIAVITAIIYEKMQGERGVTARDMETKAFTLACDSKDGMRFEVDKIRALLLHHHRDRPG